VAAGLSALLLTAACSADAPDAPAPSGGSGSPVALADGDAITFGVTGDGSLTRTAEGTIADIDGLRSAGFGVFACHHGVHPYESSSVTPNFMYNQQVTWDGSHGVWTYDPVKYWPNGDGTEENLDYISFFAYAPYSDAAGGGCITDFSKNGEAGDPWLTYQLGGTPTDWKDHQVDLLYAFVKDKQKQIPEITSTKIDFSFCHALSSIGDQVTVECGPLLLRSMMLAHVTSDVVLTLRSLTLDYELTRKGRLVLNSSGDPNWHAIESEDATVHRIVTFDAVNQVIARATSANRYTTSDYTTGDGHGVFFIPVEIPGSAQRLTVTATYSVGPWGYEHTVSYTTPISRLADAGTTRNLRVSVDDDQPIGKPVGTIAFAEAATLTVGQTYTNNTFTNTTESGAVGDGVPVFTSSDTSVATVSNDAATRGLVTAVAVGTCTITATVADTDLTTYPVKTASYGVTVTAP